MRPNAMQEKIRAGESESEMSWGCQAVKAMLWMWLSDSADEKPVGVDTE